MIPQVYFDTDVFIAAFETAGPRAEYAWWLLGAAEDGHLEAVTSELTLAEPRSKPPFDNPDLVSRYDRLIDSRPGLRVPAVDRAVLLQAAEIRRMHAGVRLPDAIHLATAIIGRCSHFVTGDLRLPALESLPIVDWDRTRRTRSRGHPRDRPSPRRSGSRGQLFPERRRATPSIRARPSGDVLG